jgi:serine/threonine protein kinase
MEVALKIFNPGTALIHAYPEARLLTSLAGERVLPVYNADSFHDVPYIATQVAVEGSAEDRLARSPTGVRPDLVRLWIRHLLIGLGSCHDRDLLHRDIKPANLFLHAVDRALLGDFGIAHHLDTLGRAPLAGSPVTIAPEMFRQGWGTIASDIYSVGVTLYRLLTGSWPFDAPTPAEVQALVVGGIYKRVRDAAPHISRRLADRVERAMAMDPAERHPSWRDLHDDLGVAGVVDRIWERIAPPHPGHAQCWAEQRSRVGALHQVCLIPTASGFEVETRRSGGTRVLEQCSSVGSAGVAARLRGVFNDI